MSRSEPAIPRKSRLCLPSDRRRREFVTRIVSYKTLADFASRQRQRRVREERLFRLSVRGPLSLQPVKATNHAPPQEQNSSPAPQPPEPPEPLRVAIKSESSPQKATPKSENSPLKLIPKSESNLPTLIPKSESSPPQLKHECESHSLQSTHKSENNLPKPAHKFESSLPQPTRKSEGSLSQPTRESENNLAKPIHKFQSSPPQPTHKPESNLPQPIHKSESSPLQLAHKSENTPAQSPQKTENSPPLLHTILELLQEQGRTQETINRKLEDVLNRLANIEKNMRVENTVSTDVRKPRFLPLKTFKDVTDFEDVAQADYDHLVQYLTYIGGYTLREAVNLCLKESIANEVAMECTWNGGCSATTTNVLQGTRFAAAIHDAVAANRKFEAPCKPAFAAAMRDGLRAAKQRHRNNVHKRQ